MSEIVGWTTIETGVYAASIFDNQLVYKKYANRVKDLLGKRSRESVVDHLSEDFQRNFVWNNPLKDNRSVYNQLLSLSTQKIDFRQVATELVLRAERE